MIEVKIVLDPVAEGISVEPVKSMVREGMCLVVGTNGDFRLVDENEAMEIMERLGKDCVVDFVMNTPYVMAYSRRNVVNIDGTKLLIGSSLIVRSDRELFLMDEEDIEEAKKKFFSRLIKIKLGPEQVVTAYEIC